MLYINIVEGVIAAYLKKLYFHTFTGILLVLTVPGPENIAVTADGYSDLVYTAPVMWILWYTVWDYVFIRSRTPHLVAIHVVVLAAPFFSGFFQLWLWGQARSFTLGVHQLLHVNFQPFFSKHL